MEELFKQILTSKGNNIIKIAIYIFLAGLFIGLILRYLDYFTYPMFPSLYPAPLYKESISGAYSEYYQLETTTLDILRSNIVPAIVLAGVGVLAAIPTAVILLLEGMMLGTSIITILEFTDIATNIKFLISSALFGLTTILFAAIGLGLGKIILSMIFKKDIKNMEKSILKLSYLAILVLIVSIITQVVLL